MSSLECMGMYMAHQMSVQRHHAQLNERLFKRAIQLSGLSEDSWHFVQSVSQVPAETDTTIIIVFTSGKEYHFRTKESLLA